MTPPIGARVAAFPVVPPAATATSPRPFGPCHTPAAARPLPWPVLWRHLPSPYALRPSALALGSSSGVLGLSRCDAGWAAATSGRPAPGAPEFVHPYDRLFGCCW